MTIFAFLMNAFSRLPFSVLHRLSDITYFFIYILLRYRRKVVRENLTLSFPEKTSKEIIAIEKKFYRNFCDLMFESLKTFTITPEELRKRCKYIETPTMKQLFASGANVVGLSSHMGNWEWLSLALSLEADFTFYGVYKPLSNQKVNDFMVHSRMRFGAIFIAIKKVKEIFITAHEKPYLLGLLSDQAPHDYSKAIEVPFLNRMSYFFPGGGVLSVQKNLVPIWGWIRRVGRSQYEWGIEMIDVSDADKLNVSLTDRHQIPRICEAHHLTEHDAARAIAITKTYARKLEEKIKMAPQDWLWSHRRWKLR